MIYCHVHFRRKPLYYIVNIIFPSGMLSVLVVLLFWLPADSGEKISLGVTIVLAFSVLLLMIADNVPKTSVAVPVIGKTVFRKQFFSLVPCFSEISVKMALFILLSWSILWSKLTLVRWCKYSIIKIHPLIDLH